MKKSKLLLGSVLLFLVSILGYASFAQAHSFNTGDSVVLLSNKTINNTVFAAGNSVDTGSEVYGDVFCAGQTVTISGTIHGDVICAGQTVNIIGNVEGDIRLAGQTITVGGKVKGNATIAGQSFILSSNAHIDGDVTIGSADGTFNGAVGRDIAAGGGSLTIGNTVGRDIKGTVEQLNLITGAKVAGNIDFSSNNEVQKASDAVVGGVVTRTEIKKNSEPKRGAVLGFGVASFIYCLLAMLLIALFLVLLFPSVLHSVTNHAMPSPWKAMLIGFVASITVPIFLIVIAITIIGIPLALLLWLAWILISLLSGPIFGFYLGRTILKSSRNSVIVMLVGTSVLLVSYFVPIIGLLTLLVAYWCGTGMQLQALLRRTPRPSYELASDTAQAPARKKK